MERHHLVIDKGSDKVGFRYLNKVQITVKRNGSVGTSDELVSTFCSQGRVPP